MTAVVATKAKIPTPEEQGFKLSTDNEWQTWPGVNAVANKVDMTAAQLRALIRTGQVRALQCPNGSWRMQPSDVELLVEAFGIEADESEDAIGSLRKGKAAQEMTVLKQAVDLVKQAHSHVETMVKSLTDPQHKALELVLDLLGKMQTRVALLEDSRDQFALAREKMMSEGTVRDLAKTQADADEARKADLWKLIMAQGPKLIAQVEASILEKNPEHGQRILAARDLVMSLDPAIVAGLLETGLLNDEQKSKVRTIINPSAAQPDSKSNGKSEVQNGT